MQGPVALTVETLVSEVVSACAARSIENVFIATDGRFRGGADLVDELRAALEARSLRPRELRDCADCVDPSVVGTLGLREATFVSELEQQVVASARFALGFSRSSWFFEALFDMAARARDVVAFEVVLETEVGLHAMSPALHEHIPFPSLGSMEGLPFKFLGELDSATTAGASSLGTPGKARRRKAERNTKPEQSSAPSASTGPSGTRDHTPNAKSKKRQKKRSVEF